jgi:hypothetical protein
LGSLIIIPFVHSFGSSSCPISLLGVVQRFLLLSWDLFLIPLEQHYLFLELFPSLASG